jgi:hypothetical protein
MFRETPFIFMSYRNLSYPSYFSNIPVLSSLLLAVMFLVCVHSYYSFSHIQLPFLLLFFIFLAISKEKVINAHIETGLVRTSDFFKQSKNTQGYKLLCYKPEDRGFDSR